MRPLLLLLLIGIMFSCGSKEEPKYKFAQKPVDPNKIEDGIHVLTGLKANDGYKVVQANCTACHSAKIITQNRATREGWKNMIRWMQANQNLWDLGENEDKILDYLAANYAPDSVGRRANLKNIEWYTLEE